MSRGLWHRTGDDGGRQILRRCIARESGRDRGWLQMKWLPDMDLNHDKQIQSLLCYRYTIGQTGVFKLERLPVESRRDGGRRVGRVTPCAPFRSSDFIRQRARSDAPYPPQSLRRYDETPRNFML